MRHRSQHEECDEKADTAIGDQGTGEYDRKHRASRAQTLGHKAGNGGHGAAVLHELAEQGAKEKNREELHQNRAALPMKVCVQWASSGSPAKPAARIAAAGASRSTLQPRYASQISSPRATRMPSNPIRQICSNKTSRSKVERRPRSDAWFSKKTCADFRPSSYRREKNSHSALSLENAELGQHLARDAVDAHAGPLRALAVARIGGLPKQGDHT